MATKPVCMDVLVDDVGSFPLPPQIERRSFERAYALSRKAIAENKDVKSDEFLWENFYQVIVDSFWKKAESGLDVVNYPQHYDMHKQLANVLEETMERGTYLIDASQAFLPEVYVIRQEAKSLYEHLGRKVRFPRLCTGTDGALLERSRNRCIQRCSLDVCRKCEAVCEKLDLGLKTCEDYCNLIG